MDPTAVIASLTLGVALLAAVFAVVQVRTMRREARVDRSLKLIGLVLSRRHSLVSISAKETANTLGGVPDPTARWMAFQGMKDGGKTQARRRAEVLVMLNLYEKIALAYRAGMVDRGLLELTLKGVMSHEYARWRWLIEIVQTDAATAGEPLDRRPFGHLALLIKAWDVADEHANGLGKRMRRRPLRNG